MSMDLFGEVAGQIGFNGGGSTVTITPTYSSGTKLADFTIGETSGAIFVDLSNYLTKSEIASAYFTKGEVNTMLLADRQYEDLTFQRRDEMSIYQPKLTAGENITIDENNVISASGGGGGALDLPTDGTPVAIGTFGSKTLYAQSVSVNANTYALCRFWTGQSGDIVLSASAIAVCNANPPTKMVVPSSITNQVSFSWLTDEYEVLPHLSIYSTLDSNLWSQGAVIKGMVIFAR